MEPTRALHRALDQTGAIVGSTTQEQFEWPTPCSQFQLRELLNHTVASVQGLADAASGRGWDMSIYGQDVLGKDAHGAFSAAAARLKEATASPSAVDKVWAMPFGETPGRRAIAIGIIEIVQHGWDIAHATGQDCESDDELSKMAPTKRSSGWHPDRIGPKG